MSILSITPTIPKDNQKPFQTSTFYLDWIIVISCFLGLLTTGGASGQSLQINKSVDQTTVNPGGHLVYTIQYNCTSITNPCQNVVIADALPTELGAQNGGTITLITNTGTASFDVSTQVVTFNLGTLPAGTTGQVSYIAQVGNLPGGTVIPNSATITSGGGSPIVSNTVSTTINTVAGLGLVKVVNSIPDLGSGNLPQGGKGYYQFVVNNGGNVPLPNLCLTDTLPFPDKLTVTSIHTGIFKNATGTVNIEYQTNLNSSWTALAGSPFTVSTNSVVPISLPAGQYVTMMRWCFNNSYAVGTYADANNLPGIYFNIAANTPLGSITNCVSGTATNAAGKYCVQPIIVPPIMGAITTINKAVNKPYPAIGDTLTYTIGLYNADTPSLALQNGVIADVFTSSELTYVPNSWSYTSSYGATAPLFSTTTVGNQTLLNWKLTGDLPPLQNISITLKAIVKNTTVATQKVNNGYVVGTNIAGCPNGRGADIYDLDNDGNTTELACHYPATITLQSLAKLTSEKLVKGQLDATYSKYPAFGTTVPGGLADYRLRVSNEGNIPMTNIQVVDILPFINDKGVLDPQTRLTQWRPNLAGPVTPPTGVTVYYSTQQNPCRPELNYSPAGCTTPLWSTAPPADITTVQSLKFDFGSIVLQPGDSLLLAWPMRAPTTAPTNGEIAWNSFGYVGTRTDNNTQLLPAEPIKVGIKVNPLVPAVYGDLVWLDINKNGVQDTGELGVSGVKVELYKDNGDGVPNKTTDALVGFTVTDAAGNYLFSSLQPGNYFAIFYPPSGYSISPSLQGTDKTVDSEGIIAAVTSLSASEIDLTWDLGIYPSSSCDVKITNTTVSPCTYSGNMSRATVNVFLTWANPPVGENIIVSVAGATPYIVTVSGGVTSPTLVSFTIAADGAAHAVTAGFSSSTSCQDATSILAPVACAPLICSLGINNVLTGDCSGTKRQMNATISWSNNPVGENIIVRWDGVPVDTILIAGGLTSPQPTSFYVTGGAGSHTLSASFASTTTCSASVTSLTVPACVLPCGLGLVVTPSLCASATNSYVLSGTVTATNVPISGTLIISSAAFSPQSFTLPAGNISATFSYSGLVSNGQVYTLTASYSNSACTPVSQTYNAPVSCSTTCVTPLASATAISPACNSANPTQANADGELLISASGAIKVAFSSGTSFAGTYASALDYTSLQTSNSHKILTSTLANPASAQAYTIRFYGADASCYTDRVVTLLPVNCICPPSKCIPIVINRVR